MVKKVVFRLFLLVFVTAVMFGGCAKKNGVTFEGNIWNADGGFLKISILKQSETIFLDSVKIEDGSFSITLPSENAGPDFYVLSLNEKEALTTLASKGERLHLKAPAQNFAANYEISGSKDAELMTQLNHQLTLFADSANHLYDVYVNDNDETLHAEVEAAYVQIKQHHRDFLLRFIQENPTSLSTIAAFYQKYDNCTFFNEKEDFNILNDIFNNLVKAYPDNENVKVLEKRL